MNTTTCTADDEGRPCPHDAVMLRPVPLCHPHRIEVALTVVPELLRDQLGSALRGAATAPAVRSELVATAVAVNVAELLHGVHDSVVYLIANGGRVKIGYTTNLKARLSALALRSDSVLLALRGGPELERALHAHFAAHRNGNSEWFELSPEIFRYAATCSNGATAAARRNATVASGSVEREIATLIELMHRRGDANAVGLADAKQVVNSRAKATAARRLKAARARFAASPKARA